MSDKKNQNLLAALNKSHINLKKSSYLFNEFFVTTVKYKTLAYLRRDAKGWVLMNKLMEYYYAERELHVEELISMIPSKVCSRATLLSLLTDCAMRKILTKTASPHDKRIKIVKPTPEFVNEFEKWSEEFYSDDNWEMKTDYKKI
jgi:DNA-binding MarR family transcriptional regulator